MGRWGQARHGNALRAKPMDIREQYEKQLKELQEAYGEAMLELRTRKKLQSLLGEDGIEVPISKLCRWFGVLRRTLYYRPPKAAPKLQPQLVELIKEMLEENRSFRFRPRVQALPSVAAITCAATPTALSSCARRRWTKTPCARRCCRQCRTERPHKAQHGSRLPVGGAPLCGQSWPLSFFLARHGVNLQRLVSYFEIWGRSQHGAGPQLAFDDDGAFGRLGQLRLDSQPLFDRQRQVVAYEALLRVSDPQGRRIAPDRFFAALDDSHNVIGVDRLCRVIHSVNFLAQQSQQQALYLNVNGRHLLGIASGRHGATFEALLAYCGLAPKQVVLEIIESSVDDLGLLQQAIAAYKSKGFRIAIDDFGARHSNFDRLWALEPDIVKLDRSLTAQAAQNPRAGLAQPA